MTKKRIRFDGRLWYSAPTVIPMHNPDAPNYVSFGRVCEQDAKEAELVREATVEREAVYAKRIPHCGYSLTNMMYGVDGKMYLMFEGRIYSRPYRKYLGKGAT